MLRSIFRPHEGVVMRATRCHEGLRSIVRKMTLLRVLSNAVFADSILGSRVATMRRSFRHTASHFPKLSGNTTTARMQPVASQKKAGERIATLKDTQRGAAPIQRAIRLSLCNTSHHSTSFQGVPSLAAPINACHEPPPTCFRAAIPVLRDVAVRNSLTASRPQYNKEHSTS
jgi:hypothetical protein